MDINCHNFHGQLSSVLEAISRSHFISFDLELSGIPGKQFSKFKLPGQGEDGKQTLQQRYEETKQAAERYHVLQMGLTCVEEDRDRGVYITRPYNFYLNPIPDKRLNVEREFTYQSGAVDFLLGHNFRMEAPFLLGVPYLSREEEATSRSLEIARRDRNTFVDIFVQDDDIKSIEFVRRVRQEVSAWSNRKTPEPSFLNIAPLNHSAPNYNGRGLNGYQKRLVHQLIRAEFPDIVSFSKHDFIQLVPYDKRREDAQLQRKIAWFEQNLARQIGLRWITEAICPDADKVLPATCTPPNAYGNLATVASWAHPPVEMTDAESESHALRFAELHNKLRAKRTVLVGHNLFLDLIYFYSCFFGSLPDRVEDFQHIIAQLFPLVFDTKYLADKINNNSPRYKSSLQEIDQELSRLPVPIIEIPPEFNKYNSDSPDHEAGFDSFLTARVLIRLSARIEGEESGSQSPSSEDDLFYPASEDGGVPIYETDDPEAYSNYKLATNGDVARTTWISEAAEQDVSGAFKNQFELLGLDPDYHEQSLSPLPEPNPQPRVPTMMPAGDSPFWIRYGNKLRVNGTVEEVCIIR